MRLMPRKIILLVAFSAFLITTCKAYAQGGVVTSANGLSCQNYTNYRFLTQEEGAECVYQCPDGTLRQPNISGNFSPAFPLYSASKQELDEQFCGMAPQLTPTETLAVTPTTSASLTVTAQASPTIENSPTPSPPLLSGEVTLCDQTAGLISFRMVESAPDLTDKVLTVQMFEQELACAVNPVNTSLLTCTLPSLVAFPASVFVSLDGAVVNDFTYDGMGCVLIDTPIPALTSTP